jgi:hypothetical protein
LHEVWFKIQKPTQSIESRKQSSNGHNNPCKLPFSNKCRKKAKKKKDKARAKYLNKIKNTKINQTPVKYSSSLGNENAMKNKKRNRQKKMGKSCENRRSSKIGN